MWARPANQWTVSQLCAINMLQTPAWRGAEFYYRYNQFDFTRGPGEMWHTTRTHTTLINLWDGHLIATLITRHHIKCIYLTMSTRWSDHLTTQSDRVITELNPGKTCCKKVKPNMSRLLISFLLLTGTAARWQESLRPKMVVDYLKHHAGKKMRY